ncbi:hypothetical protein C0991_001771, partial [Blastosporella zonata]
MLSSLLRRFSTAAKVSEPLHLAFQTNQIVHNRYRILERLGQGVEATVWLAQDNTTHQTFALKVLTDYATSLQEVHAFELRTLKRISELQSTSWRTTELVHMQDHFHLLGLKGNNHLCLVTEALGLSVLKLQRKSNKQVGLPAELVQHIVRQVLSALSTLHDGCQVVHTGVYADPSGYPILPDNILFRRSVTKEGGELDIDRLYDEDNVVLVDYGTSVPLDVKTNRLIQPVALRAPEVLLGCSWGVKADIWNLGCIVFELLTANSLFRPRSIDDYSMEQYHLARIYGTLANQDNDLERLREFFKTGKKYDKFFHASGGLRLKIHDEYRESLQGILEIYGVYTPNLLQFLEAMLRIHPDARLSAKELQ